MFAYMSIAYLCANSGTVLKQLGSFPRVLPYAGSTATIGSIGHFMQNPKRFMEECYKLDPQLKARNGDPFIQELRKYHEEVIKEDYIEEFEVPYTSMNIGLIKSLVLGNECFTINVLIKAGCLLSLKTTIFLSFIC